MIHTLHAGGLSEKIPQEYYNSSIVYVSKRVIQTNDTIVCVIKLLLGVLSLVVVAPFLLLFLVRELLAADKSAAEVRLLAYVTIYAKY